MKVRSCYVTNYLSDLTYYENRNNKKIRFKISPIFTAHTKSQKYKIRLITDWSLHISKGCVQRMIFQKIIKKMFFVHCLPVGSFRQSEGRLKSFYIFPEIFFVISCSKNVLYLLEKQSINRLKNFGKIFFLKLTPWNAFVFSPLMQTQDLTWQYIIPGRSMNALSNFNLNSLSVG